MVDLVVDVVDRCPKVLPDVRGQVGCVGGQRVPAVIRDVTATDILGLAAVVAVATGTVVVASVNRSVKLAHDFRVVNLWNLAGTRLGRMVRWESLFDRPTAVSGDRGQARGFGEDDHGYSIGHATTLACPGQLGVVCRKLQLPLAAMSQPKPVVPPV